MSGVLVTGYICRVLCQVLPEHTLMPIRIDSRSADFASRFKAFLATKREVSADIEAATRAIVEDVKTRGDAALIEATRRFDRLSVDADGDQITFVFHTHNYGGSVQISFEGEEQIVDLYSELHGWKIYTCKNPGKAGSSFTVTIETLSRTNPNSFGDEFWLAQVIFGQRQKWQGTSYPVTKWCNVTHGQYGSFLTWASDTVVGATIVRDGAWARSDLDRMGQYIKPGMTVLDVGANIGHHTIAFSKMVGSTGRVIAWMGKVSTMPTSARAATMSGWTGNSEKAGCTGASAAVWSDTQDPSYRSVGCAAFAADAPPQWAGRSEVFARVRGSLPRGGFVPTGHRWSSSV